MLVAAACVQVLHRRRALHVYECLYVCVLFFYFILCTHRRISLKVGVLLLVSCHSTLASVYLWTKGCFEANDLAPVSQSRRTRDERRGRSETWKGKMMEAFRRTEMEAGGVKEENEREKS